LSITFKSYTVGTIFAIYRFREDNTIQSGRDIVAAGYCLYGGSTQLILAEKSTNCVKMYRLCPASGNVFILIEPTLRIPNKGGIYSINESNRHRFTDPKINIAIGRFIAEGKTARWVGSLVADAHRTIVKGGFFAYPGNTKHPNGKLRLLYEVYPFAFIIEMCGGTSTSTGLEKSILDVPFPEDPHQKIPTILSSYFDMDTYLKPFKD
jgi:fructose-1,6-bisphosphatase I